MTATYTGGDVLEPVLFNQYHQEVNQIHVVARGPTGHGLRRNYPVDNFNIVCVDG